MNLSPSKFSLDPGFVSRAIRLGKPRTLTLNDSERLLSFSGSRAAGPTESDARRLAQEDLESLARAPRKACKYLIVSWIGPDDSALAAAFEVFDGKATQARAFSWLPARDWPEPEIDSSKSPEEALEDALANIAAMVTQRRGNDATAFRDGIARGIRVVDATLRVFGGEGQEPGEIPAREAEDAVWDEWRQRYDGSIRDEWRRIGRGAAATRFHRSPAAPPADGPLRGLTVFVSYARPDATRLAAPVHDALVASGARVWFDQRLVPDNAALDTGLYDVIGAYDAFVMCGSDEYLERAGYATQELAWALQQRAGASNPGRVAVVAPRGTLLPRHVAGWPRVDMLEIQALNDSERLARDLIAALAQPVAAAETDRIATLSDRPEEPPAVSRQMSVALALLRVRHVRAFHRFSGAAMKTLLTGSPKAEARAIYRQLREISGRLDWDGSLLDIESWPLDAIVRDIRMRLGAAKALAELHEFMSDEDEPRLIRIVSYLATQPVSLATWPATTGWDDFERRVAIRYHAGVLRVLEDLFTHGYHRAFPSLAPRTRERWETEVLERRRECYEALLDLRLRGRLEWRADPLTWDQMFEAFDALRVGSRKPWRDAIPFEVSRLLYSNTVAIAAAGADVVWTVSRTGRSAVTSFHDTDNVAIEVFASGPRADTTTEEKLRPTDNAIRIGVVSTGAASADLRLSWNVPGFPADVRVGQTLGPAPTQLSGALNRSRS